MLLLDMKTYLDYHLARERGIGRELPTEGVR